SGQRPGAGGDLAAPGAGRGAGRAGGGGGRGGDGRRLGPDGDGVVRGHRRGGSRGRGAAAALRGGDRDGAGAPGAADRGVVSALWRTLRGHPWLLLVAAVVLAYLLFGEHLPEIDIEHILQQLAQRLGQWTYVLAGLLAFLETGAFVGLVFPGET